jgi:hypothetical protein
MKSNSAEFAPKSEKNEKLTPRQRAILRVGAPLATIGALSGVLAGCGPNKGPDQKHPTGIEQPAEGTAEWVEQEFEKLTEADYPVDKYLPETAKVDSGEDMERIMDLINISRLNDEEKQLYEMSYDEFVEQPIEKRAGYVDMLLKIHERRYNAGEEDTLDIPPVRVYDLETATADELLGYHRELTDGIILYDKDQDNNARVDLYNKHYITTFYKDPNGEAAERAKALLQQGWRDLGIEGKTGGVAISGSEYDLVNDPGYDAESGTRMIEFTTQAPNDTHTIATAIVAYQLNFQDLHTGESKQITLFDTVYIR